MQQVSLARDLGVSQPRISQIMRLLASHGIEIEHLDDADQRRRLVDLYVVSYRPAVVSESLFYGLDSPYEQIAKVVRVARHQSVDVAVSADLAHDLIAPWRTPTLTVVYTDSPLDIKSGPFVPAMARGEATLIVRHVSDTSLLELWPTQQGDPPVVHPVQQVWDLIDLGGEDRLEAAERIIEWLLDRMPNNHMG